MQPEGYVPHHTGADPAPGGEGVQAPSPPAPPAPRRRRPRRLFVVVAGVVVGLMVLAVGAWLALRGGGGGNVAAFCDAASVYFVAPEQLPGDADAVRALVDERVAAAAALSREAPEEIAATAAEHAKDVAAAREVFERHDYSPTIVDEALTGTLDPPADTAAVLRVMGFSYSGDAAGDRATRLATFSAQHCGPTTS